MYTRQRQNKTKKPTGREITNVSYKMNLRKTVSKEMSQRVLYNDKAYK